MPTWWRWLSRGLLEMLSPGCCHLCGRHIPQVEQVFCEACRGDLLTDPYLTCPHCAGSIGPYALTAGGCVHCRKANFPFKQALRLGPYLDEGPLHDLVLRLKRPTGEFLARLIVRLWLERDLARFEALGVDAVVAVPSHWRRRLWLGYDHTAALARELALQLHLSCELSWLYRARHTPRQVGLSNTDRQTNVNNAFAVKKRVSLKGRSLLLVDDVMTTGATLREAARPLVRAGAAQVAVAVLARRSIPS
jgi:ComF family protein